MSCVEIQSLLYGYHPERPILNIDSLSIESGEFVFLHGPSGCGKTTLLGLLAGVLHPQQGKLSVLGQELPRLSHSERDRLRAHSIGYIFQAFNLVPYLSVYENIALPSLFGRAPTKEFSSVKEESIFLAQALGIQAMLDRPVGELSIGQQQRVAAARALLGSPGLILADEPTSALDSDARLGFLDLLFTHARREKATVLFVSHDRSLAPKFDRELSLPKINRASVTGGVQ